MIQILTYVGAMTINRFYKQTAHLPDDAFRIKLLDECIVHGVMPQHARTSDDIQESFLICKGNITMS